MWNIEDEVVEIIAMRGVIPSDQALINIINIANQERERLTCSFDLGNVRENIWVGAEINMLHCTARL